MKTIEATQIIKTERRISNLSFSYNTSYLQTECGPLYINQSSPSAGQLQPDFQCYFYVNEQWLAWGTENILWLPPNYRPANSPANRKCVVAKGDIVVIGH